MTEANNIKNYFVDEAGDPVIFNAKGQVIIGNDGCSKFFMLGFLDIMDADSLAKDIQKLRDQMLADPYFKKVPSMQSERRKTFLAFHAKDDIPEVRKEVYALLLKHDMKFHAVIRNKHEVLAYAYQQREKTGAYRYNPNELYDSLVKRLFKNRLHLADHHNVYFAKRGSKDRTVALKEALITARSRFLSQWGKTSNSVINPEAAYPHEIAGLQAVDYFLWALQRLYERHEDRYLSYVWEKISLIHDVDDHTAKGYGVYYNRKKPIDIEKIKKIHGI
jgi:hypothetical protein